MASIWDLIMFTHMYWWWNESRNTIFLVRAFAFTTVFLSWKAPKLNELTHRTILVFNVLHLIALLTPGVCSLFFDFIVNELMEVHHRHVGILGQWRCWWCHHGVSALWFLCRSRISHLKTHNGWSDSASHSSRDSSSISGKSRLLQITIPTKVGIRQLGIGRKDQGHRKCQLFSSFHGLLELLVGA